MTKKLLVFFSWIVLINGFVAQTQHPFLKWEDVRHASPDTVYYISFSKSKVSEIPKDLAQFHKVKGLDLSRNRLTTLPEFFGSFDSLVYLDLSRNNFDLFPIELCRLTNLQKLIFNRNNFSQLPECIQYLERLNFLDLWATPVISFPPGMKNLKSLKTLDLQGNRYSPSFQKQLQNELPTVNVVLDPPCNCMN
jgi:Leucine-rich repeat (LRR) protein